MGNIIELYHRIQISVNPYIPRPGYLMFFSAEEFMANSDGEVEVVSRVRVRHG